MRIDIWLDIRCPNCYIAKQKFRLAFERFEHRNKVNINWRSYELSTIIQPMPGKTVYEYLAELKDRSLDWSKQIHKQVADAAAELGLVYNFDKTIIANSFNGHRLVQYAKTINKGSDTIDRLYYGYFTEGADLNDLTTLEELGISAGLPAEEVRKVLHSDLYAAEVRADEAAADKVVKSVPFFLINNMKAFSGGHSVEMFHLQLVEGWEQYRRLLQDPPIPDDDESCSIYGFC